MMRGTTDRRERVYLTGFMGSGKSTVGPIVANTIGYDFVDLDRVIEEEEHASVSEIFRARGEEYFRRCERERILALSHRARVVISLGGGTHVDPEVNTIIHATGIVVYLKITLDDLVARLKHRNDRPLLAGPDGEKLPADEQRRRIESLYTQRAPIYETADLTVEVDGSRVGLTVDRIVRRLVPLLR